jgi:tRNA dimethylallyltransferase
VSKPRLAIITGPTGAGKSELSLLIAEALGGEIINADSLALYRGFDIGTAKPSLAERERIPHHLIDVLNPDEDFDAAAYLRAARPIAVDLGRRNLAPLAVGGTGFYLRSLTSGLFEGPGRDPVFRAALKAERANGVDLHARLKAYDPETAARVAPADQVRIERALEVLHLTGRSISAWQKEHGLAEKPFACLAVVIDRHPEEMEARIRERTRHMFDAGLAAETEGLLSAGWAPELKPFQSIGYKETLEYLSGDISLEKAIEKTAIAVRRFAKRQRTWFRGQLGEAAWFHPDQRDDLIRLFRDFFKA